MTQKSYKQFWLEGLVPAVFTPFHEDGELNLSKIDEYCEFLLKNNIRAVFVNGTTGEGKSLTKEERKIVAEKWIFTASGRLKVVVNISGLNVRESIELAKHAVHIRADAIASLPPLFFKPNSTESLVDHCKMVAEAAPSLPFYYYHLPTMTGVELKMEDFLIMAKKKIPNLIGLKFASKDLGDMIGCLFAGKFNILCGCDEFHKVGIQPIHFSRSFFPQQLMGNLVMGAHGAVGTLYNFMPQVFHRLLQHLSNGEMEKAREEQIRAQKVLRLMVKYVVNSTERRYSGYSEFYNDSFGSLQYCHSLGGNVAAVKPMMALVGLDLGPPRHPMRPMTVDELIDFHRDVDLIGFKDWEAAILL